MDYLSVTESEEMLQDFQIWIENQPQLPQTIGKTNRLHLIIVLIIDSQLSTRKTSFAALFKSQSLASGEGSTTS